jgi:hypothetical protein
MVQTGQVNSSHNGCELDLNTLKTGIYTLIFEKDAVKYRARVSKI